MNWGYKMTAVFIVFAFMISYLVYRAMNVNFELVDKEYYKNELKYQEVIDGSENANALKFSPVLKQSGQQISITMPIDSTTKTVQGSAYFYCAYNQSKDRKFQLHPDRNGNQEFNQRIDPGTYTVKIKWCSDGRNFYTEQQLTVL